MVILRCPSCGASCLQSISKCPYCGCHLISDEILANGPASSRYGASSEFDQAPVPPGWSRYTDAWCGISLSCPPGYRVRRNAPAFFVTNGAPLPSTALLWPVRLDSRLTVRQLAEQFVQSARLDNPSFTAWCVPESHPSPDRMLLHTSASRGAGTLAGSATVTVGGGFGLISAFSVPASDGAPQAAELIDVLKSFRSIPALPTFRFMEPMQGAFEVQVPAGWTASGEAPPNPMGDASYQRFACAADPAGLTRVSIESLRHWIFNESRFLQVMSLGLARTMPYVPAPEFALKWMVPHLRKEQPQMEVLGVVECPDMLPRLYEDIAHIGQTPQEANLTTACLTTRYAAQGRPVIEKTFIYLTRPRGPAASRAGFSSSFLAFAPVVYRAPEEDFACADPVLDGIRLSHRISEQWRQRELARMNALSQEIARQASARLAQISHTLSETTDIITSSYWQRQKTYDHVFHQQQLVTMGTADVTDPGTGKIYNVPNSYDQYWRDSAGYVYGGTWSSQPDPTWQKLEPIRL